METFQLDSAWFADFVDFLGGAEAIDAKARALKAFQRARGVASAIDLVRLALMYGPGGCSLRGLAAAAEADGVARISDPAALKRLRGAADLIEALCGDALLGEQRRAARLDETRGRTRPVRLVDASRLEGPSGRCWRLHMAYDPCAQTIREARITTMRVGEAFGRFQPQPGDIVIGDRGYAQPDGLRSVIEAEADVIVRVTWNSLKLTDPDGRPLDWLGLLHAARERETLEVPVSARKARGRYAPLAMRMLFIKKPPEAAERARAKAWRASQKDQRKQVDPRTLEAADFLILLTSLPVVDFPLLEVGALYRLRWQIELAFKRLKSILHIDELEARGEATARTWLHAHLLLALYVNRLQDRLEVFSL
jgi:hypothetical protein